MIVGLVWPTPGAEAVPPEPEPLARTIAATAITHLRVNLDHRNPQADAIVARVRDAGVELLPILDLDYAAPNLPAYADFSERMVATYGFPIVEPLNEPRILGKMPAGVFGEIATVVGRRLAPYRPLTRLALAADMIEPHRQGPFIKRRHRVIDGRLRYVSYIAEARIPFSLYDVAAIHPYREPGAPAVCRYGHRQHEYEAYADECGDLPLIVTEVGWNLAEVDEALQARYLFDELVLNEQCGIEAVYIYSMVSEMTTGMGVMREDWTPRPAAEAIRRFQQGARVWDDDDGA